MTTLHGAVRSVPVETKTVGKLSEAELKRFLVRQFLRKYKGKNAVLNSLRLKTDLTNSQVEMIHDGIKTHGRNFGRDVPVPEGTSMSDRYTG